MYFFFFSYRNINFFLFGVEGYANELSTWFVVTVMNIEFYMESVIRIMSSLRWYQKTISAGVSISLLFYFYWATLLWCELEWIWHFFWHFSFFVTIFSRIWYFVMCIMTSLTEEVNLICYIAFNEKVLSFFFHIEYLVLARIDECSGILSTNFIGRICQKFWCIDCFFESSFRAYTKQYLSVRSSQFKPKRITS